ncbi:MAG: iron-sulfur cluster assembly accessory protein [Planctomycetes bacterium]|nr:iron-sulfur cluster assembly accessory protein [Planctomycetota bacterium]
MIQVTPAASREIQRIMADQKLPSNTALRLFVQAGGCAGMSYGMDFVQEPKSGDKSFEVSGVMVYMDPKSYLLLHGMTVDFKESLMGRGFVFQNPNASGQCGCGTSFAVGDESGAKH